MIAATRATQSTVSKNPRNQKEISVSAASFEKSARMSRLAISHTTASTPNAAPARPSPFARQSGSTNQMIPKIAGMRTTPRNTISHQRVMCGSDAANA